MEKLDTENNQILTNARHTITFKYLVMSQGFVMQLELIEGLQVAMDKGVVHI